MPRHALHSPPRTVLKLNERIFRFCVRDRHAPEALDDGFDPSRPSMGGRPKDAN
jgi:hypothetical protein